MPRRSFDVPTYFRSDIVGRIKRHRSVQDPRRKDVEPSVLDFGPVRVHIARHFGFCYGVENAIEIAYRTVEEHPDKRIFLLSEMIHNPRVNDDLRELGVEFIMTTHGEQIVPWDEVTQDDIVIVPAFGTTVETQNLLKSKGIDPFAFDTTCPFVQKVWNRSEKIGESGFTVVVHGKPQHEETRATFSHSRLHGPTVIVRDMTETERLAEFIVEDRDVGEFQEWFGRQASEGFDPTVDLSRIGVVNQTTMLATETQAIADRLREAVVERYGEANLGDHYVDTRDTLCYATNENQSATLALIDQAADVSLVVGGYNSSNTSHLAELSQERLPTFFIEGPEEIVSDKVIRHFDLERSRLMEAHNWLPTKRPVDILLTSGASCPDALVDQVLIRVLELFDNTVPIEEAVRVHVGEDSSGDIVAGI
jgi:4-hydroxy-3-methylbut-2-enyl diphosphate reductase